MDHLLTEAGWLSGWSNCSMIDARGVVYPEPWYEGSGTKGGKNWWKYVERELNCFVRPSRDRVQGQARQPG